MPGTLSYIGISPRPKATILECEEVTALAHRGLEGDHRARRGEGGRRQVTVISMEGLPVIASRLGVAEVVPAQLRRNLGIQGLSWEGGGGRWLQIGDVLLERTVICEPCQRMEDTVGPGGLEAVGEWGGWNFRVHRGGPLTCGMQARWVESPEGGEG